MKQIEAARIIADERIMQFKNVVAKLTKASWNVTNLVELGALRCIAD